MRKCSSRAPCASSLELQTASEVLLLRKLFILTLLCAVFLGGYYAGRQPGSPDLIAGVAVVAEGLYEFGKAAAGAVEQAAEAAGFNAAPAQEPPAEASAPVASHLESRGRNR